jgi:hypothetical protein
MLEKARWFEREVEARWQQMIARAPDVPAAEFLWAKQPSNDDGAASFDDLTTRVASLLGFGLATNRKNLKQHDVSSAQKPDVHNDQVQTRTAGVTDKESSAPFLSVDIWLELADYVFDLDDFEQSRKMFPASAEIVFLRGRGNRLIPKVLSAILDAVTTPKVLLFATNYDTPTPDHPHDQTDEVIHSHPNLRRIYTKNPRYSSERLQPLPLGPKWQKGSRAYYGEPKEVTKRVLSSITTGANDTAALFSKGTRTITLLLSHYSPGRGDREQNVHDLLATAASIITTETNKDLPAYLADMTRARFVFSPPGAGYDCHRHWEALLCGCIPIVKSSPVAEALFSGLPVWIVDNYTQVDSENAERKYSELMATPWEFERLFAPYWRAHLRQ